MTKAELIDKLYSTHKGAITKRLVGELVDGVFDTMSQTLKKEQRFAFPGFGTWQVKKLAKRKGRNPQTGEVINIKASKTVRFKPAKGLKEKV